jgi:adenylosuccinate synthase
MGKETTWEALGVAPEITTVTKKVRRVSEWDDEVFEKAVWLNQPCGVWLTFIDYIDPDLTGCRDAETVLSSTKAVDFINHIERDFDVPVVGVSTGGDGWACVNIASCAHDEYWPTVFTKDANAAGMTRR